MTTELQKELNKKKPSRYMVTALVQKAWGIETKEVVIQKPYNDD